MIDLIRSLSQSEKRYFKLSLMHHSDNQKIVGLFEHIDKHRDRTEKQMKITLPLELKKYYSVYKSTLQEKLLSALRAYHTKDNPRYHVSNLFVEIDILFNKKLIDLCRKKMRKLRTLIEEHELIDDLPRLILLENLPGMRGGYLSLDELNFVEINQGKTVFDIGKSMEYRLLPHKFVALRNAYRASRSAQDRTLLEAFCVQYAQPVGLEKKLDVMSQVNLLNTRSLIFEFQDEHTSAWKCRRKIGDLFMAHPKIIRANASRFIDMFYNYMISCLKTENFREGLEACDRLESSSSRYRFKLTNHLNSRVFEYSATMRLLLLIKSGNYDSHDLVYVIEEAYPAHKKHIRPNSQLVLIYFISFHFFVNQDYKKALKWINTIQDVKKHDDPEILTAANLFMIILHIEMDHRDYLENYFRSSLYFLKKKSRVLLVERLVLEIAKQFVAVKMTKEILKLSLETLETSELSPMDVSLMYSFDLKVWLRSKLEETTFKKALKNPS